MLSVIYAVGHLCWVSFVLSVVYAYCRKLAIYAERHHDECRYAECHGAIKTTHHLDLNEQQVETASSSGAIW
jgi:hypothetical protein